MISNIPREILEEEVEVEEFTETATNKAEEDCNKYNENIYIIFY